MGCWIGVEGDALRQGDHLSNCLIPMMELTAENIESEESQTIPVGSTDLIIVTQSCDLAQRKADFVALCPIYSIEEFSNANAAYKAKNKREEIRKGKIEGLHLLPAFIDAGDNTQALVIDFRRIYSLPLGMLEKHAKNLGKRWRLNSPHLEHFSQGFARFFMRVGLPTEIPPYK